MLSPPAHPQLTVWYNTKCPVCDAGIAWQRQRLIKAARAGTIAFRDINLEPEALAGHGVSLEDIRRRLNGLDAGGHLVTGIDCAIAIWRLTPGTVWLARLFSLPGIHALANFGYDAFANLLYAWNRRNGRW